MPLCGVICSNDLVAGALRGSRAGGASRVDTVAMHALRQHVDEHPCLNTAGTRHAAAPYRPPDALHRSLAPALHTDVKKRSNEILKTLRKTF